MDMKHIIKAKSLRDKNVLNSVPADRPGWYRWWARESEVRALLDSRFLPKKYFDPFIKILTKGSGELQEYYYIYTGVAIKESIRARLNWHVNQRHGSSAVKSGTLSTLRQTLSSLICGNQMDEGGTNVFIDKLCVEYFPLNEGIKTAAATEILDENEKKEMAENILVLNIKNNKKMEIAEFRKALSNARSAAKKTGLALAAGGNK